MYVSFLILRDHRKNKLFFISANEKLSFFYDTWKKTWKMVLLVRWENKNLPCEWWLSWKGNFLWSLAKKRESMVVKVSQNERFCWCSPKVLRVFWNFVARGQVKVLFTIRKFFSQLCGRICWRILYRDAVDIWRQFFYCCPETFCHQNFANIPRPICLVLGCLHDTQLLKSDRNHCYYYLMAPKKHHQDDVSVTHLLL